MASFGVVTVGGMSVDTSKFDLSDHSSRSNAVRSSCIVLIALVAIFVSLRIFVRLYIIRKIFADDVLIMIAATFTIALPSVCIAAIKYGLGTHVWLLNIATVMQIVSSCIQYLYVCQVVYTCAIAFTKIAIISSYLRFIHDKVFRMAMYITGAVIVCLRFTSLFATVFQCTPVRAAWNFFLPKRHCINFVDYLYAFSAISVTTDIILCVLPWPYLWKLKMPRKQRIILCLLFAGGAGACVAGIVRIGLLYTLRSFDIPFTCVPCLILSVVECSLGIICVSIPALRPLIVRLYPKALQTDRSWSRKSPVQSAALAKKSSKSQTKHTNQPEMTDSSNFRRDQDIESRGIDNSVPIQPQRLATRV
ncbi:hypothetical protein K491DRAFT_385322 [Lophiostoma macrostomum CBS 122681]|uniref:Rhodopsin domain-containing protein n=1 Tax=Lophiostoma macrostomum CBS 122681 TaxID=1314788 RepID=A0A6A6TS93_9PLEO|nr:hypothetical protein K491DRAFT_385322 [Lophiostoma macrostomum CBS 122681]